MKNYYLLILSIMFISFLSCKKSNIQTSGTASTNLNGKSWEANMVAGKSMSDSTISFILRINKLNEYKEAYPYEGFSFRILKNKKQQILGEYLSYPSASFKTYIEQGHASNERFEVLTTDTVNNWVQITEESDDFKHIKGEFTMTLIKTKEGIDPNRYPDTLRITDGKFDLTMD